MTQQGAPPYPGIWSPQTNRNNIAAYSGCVFRGSLISDSSDICTLPFGYLRLVLNMFVETMWNMNDFIFPFSALLKEGRRGGDCEEAWRGERSLNIFPLDFIEVQASHFEAVWSDKKKHQNLFSAYLTFNPILFTNLTIILSVCGILVLSSSKTLAPLVVYLMVTKSC